VTPDVGERKALIWFRIHGPTGRYDRTAPTRSMRLRLLNRGWIELSRKRKRFEPMNYEISEAGRKVLEP
jgi:hypothetical protein